MIPTSDLPQLYCCVLLVHKCPIKFIQGSGLSSWKKYDHVTCSSSVEGVAPLQVQMFWFPFVINTLRTSHPKVGSSKIKLVTTEQTPCADEDHVLWLKILQHLLNGARDMMQKSTSYQDIFVHYRVLMIFSEVCERYLPVMSSFKLFQIQINLFQ